MAKGTTQNRRSEDRALLHYRIERELAQELMRAPREGRYRVYCEVYDKLFQMVQDHPQLQIDPARRELEATRKLRFVGRFVGPQSSLLEVGAGDCAFARLAAKKVRRVIALDVSEVIVSVTSAVPNLEVILTDGIAVPLPPESIDAAYSDQLIEHLHPEDVTAQLSNIVKALVPGGVYVCITPNGLTGPHDVSRSFTETPTGFHLREYTNGEVRALMLQAGFRQVHFYAGGRGRYVRVPGRFLAGVEKCLQRLPGRTRRRLGDMLLVQAILGVTAVGIR